MSKTQTVKPINLLKSEYKLLGKIGSGGFSLVYLVESLLNNGRLCAAKFQVFLPVYIYIYKKKYMPSCD